MFDQFHMPSWVNLCSRFELLVSILEGFDYKGFQSKAIKRNAATQMAPVYPEGLRMEGWPHISAVTTPVDSPHVWSHEGRC